MGLQALEVKGWIACGIVPPHPPLHSPPKSRDCGERSIFGSCSDLTCRVLQQDCLETGRVHPPACRIHGYFTAVVCGKDKLFLLKFRMRNYGAYRETSSLGSRANEGRIEIAG